VKLGKWINRIQVPNDVGRMPGKWTGKLGYFKAIEWSTWAGIYSVPSLTAVGVEPCYILPLVFLYRISYLLRLRTITKLHVKEIDNNIKLFIMFSVWVLGTKFVCPNLHFLRHIPELLIKFGPACNWWCFPYERFTGQVNSLPRNENQAIPSMMHSWLKYSKVSEYFMKICMQSSALQSKLEKHYASCNKLEMFREELSRNPLHMPGLPNMPSAFYQFSSLAVAQRGTMVLGVDDDHDVSHRVNSQGRSRGIDYRLTKEAYQRLLELQKMHEKTVKGNERIPWFPRDSESKVVRQIYTFHNKKLIQYHHSLNLKSLESNGPRSPPHLEQLTPSLLHLFYSDRYTYDWNSSSPVTQAEPDATVGSSKLVFVDILDNGEKLELYRQVDICGELYSSMWANQNGGYFKCLLYNEQRRCMTRRFGQCCFFFKHSLTMKSEHNSTETVQVQHILAFVRMLKEVRCPQLEHWKDPWLNTASAKEQKKIRAKARKDIVEREASAVLGDAHNHTYRINSNSIDSESLTQSTKMKDVVDVDDDDEEEEELTMDDNEDGNEQTDVNYDNEDGPVDDNDSDEESKGNIIGIQTYAKAQAEARLKVTKASRHILYKTLAMHFPVVWLGVPQLPKSSDRLRGSPLDIKALTPEYAILPIQKLQERVIVGQTHDSVGVMMSIQPKRHVNE
jgi:hypothetical protein